ncbi:AraC-like protein [Frondihabitans sp. PhB188]|uniref:helix-turn-helix domain-containing protein n=1 Tax=Frondihabitans sp. PhB188 TaxID=2485200 RepID=UPI000FB336F1|nr:helix-turn-helix domain-containing protein [Frondihabitans sp. PhB188]ROQ37119.1 AraC-like protein [Frondihabitans sp. PhB188]
MSTTPATDARSQDPDPISSLVDAPLARFEVSGRSAAEAARLSERAYGGARFTALEPDEPFSFRFASLGDENVSLRLSSLSGTLVGEIGRLDDYVATWFRQGGGRIATTRETLDLRPGGLAVLPSSESFRFETGPGLQNLVHVARPFLERIATERHGGPEQPLAFRHQVRPSESGLAQWRQTMSAASPVITDADAPPLIRMESNLAVARTLLDVFSWHTHHVPAALLTPRLAKVRATVEFLHENAHLPITPADAASAVGLNTRSMQNSFQRHLEMSPTEYLRRVRLDRVRRDLLEHTPKTATVNDLARAWGFGNLGRFASSYQARFGEKPNETLRRGRPSGVPPLAGNRSELTVF